MIAILGFIGILFIGFVVLGLLGWGVQAIGFIAAFLGDGITGCIGCSAKFFWVILIAGIFIALIS